MALSAALGEAQERDWAGAIGEDAMIGLEDGLAAFVASRGGFDSPLRLRPTW